MRTILLISPYWKEEHRWMVSSVKLAELWQRLGYRVVVACMGKPQGVTRVSETLTIHRFRDFFLPDPLNFGIAPGFARRVRRLIREEKPDLVVCNKVLFWTSFALIPLWLRGHKVLLLTDTLVGMTWWPRSWLPKLIMGAGAWTMGWLTLLFAEKIVFFHPQSPRLLQRLGIAKKSQVIPTGIDLQAFSSQRSAMSTDYKLTVTYVGRLESVKGVDDFLEAVTPLRRQYPELSVRVIGWYRDRHPLVSKFSDHVTFTGLRDDVPSLLQETDIFVLPSYSEGLSNALMEAMASGCACVASDTGGNRFLIQNGVSGFLFSPGDREALRSHVHRLIEDPMKRRSLGANARRRIEETFNWEEVGKQYQALFEEFLRGAEITTLAPSAPSAAPRTDSSARSESGAGVPLAPRVVILSAFLSPLRSGAEACVEEVALRLCPRYDITIVTAKMRRDLPRCDVLRGRVPVVRVGCGFSFDKWLYPFLAPLATYRLRPHLVHAVLETFAGLALLFLRWMYPSTRRLLTLQTLNRSFLKGSIVRSPDGVTAISQALREVAESCGRRDVSIIPNGVDYAAIRSACGRYPKIPGRILFVGRLERMKGVDTLLEAFMHVVENFPEAHLRIVGDGSMRPKLEIRNPVKGRGPHGTLRPKSEMEGRVTFVGYVPPPAVYEEFAQAAIFCALPRSEALGNVFLEAQAAGCAVIGTNVGGIPDSIADGETGFLVPPNDPEVASGALQTLLKDASLCAKFSEAARRNSESFDWDHIADRYAGLYESLLSYC